MDDKKKVLIITYYWPPASGPGVQRFLKMSKYLLSFGWKPIILTVKNGSYPSRDESLVEEVPQETPVFRTKSFEPFSLYNRLTGGNKNESTVGLIGIQNSKSLTKRLSLFIRANLFLPDARKGWNRFALSEAKKILRDQAPEVIVTTGPPHSTHLIGYTLKKQLGIRWVADMRDPWTNMYFNKMLPKTRLTQKIDKKTEDRIIQSADGITTVSPGLREEFADRAKNIQVVYNGFDPEDLPEPEPQMTKYFTLSYIGNFKPNQNIEALWQAIARLKDEKEGFGDRFRIQLTGNIDPGIHQSLKKLGLTDITDQKAFLPHKEATRVMNESNMLLFIVPKAESNKGIITGKLFEYLAVRSPILSIGPTDGDAATIIRNADRDEMLDYTDQEKMEHLISYYYDQWMNDDTLSFKHTETEKSDFSRRTMARQFSEFLKTIAP